uniref:Uncharacterized protein n=1 Tax=Macrostomum lignano TaxID=282301 RepID=A0A1I8JRG6_9PLAT
MNVQFSPTSESLTEAKWLPNKRGCSFMFSGVAIGGGDADVPDQMLIRGHQVAHKWFSDAPQSTLVTVFSAPRLLRCLQQRVQHPAGGPHGDNNRHPGSFFIIRPTHRDAAAINNLFWTELQRHLSPWL